MDQDIAAQERAYWEREVESRNAELRDAQGRNEPAFQIAALQLRLDEAERRVAAM